MEYYQKKRLYEYFSNKSDRTKEEQELLNMIISELKFFDISSLHRDHLEDVKCTQLVDDNTMARIAVRMDDAYWRNGFYEDLQNALEHEGLS